MRGPPYLGPGRAGEINPGSPSGTIMGGIFRPNTQNAQFYRSCYLASNINTQKQAPAQSPSPFAFLSYNLLPSKGVHPSIYGHNVHLPLNGSTLLGLGSGSSLEWFGEVPGVASSSMSCCNHPWPRVVMAGPSCDGSCNLALISGFSFMGESLMFGFSN
jgi:hypothetical protein